MNAGVPSPLPLGGRGSGPFFFRRAEGLIVLLLVLLFAPIPAAAGLFGAERFRLDNGLEVVVVENHRAPMVVHMLWFKVGAADEPPGLSGLAHLTEHLLFAGTPRVPAGEFSRQIAANGGEDNAFTGRDFTATQIVIAADRLELAMRLEADRLANLDPAAPRIATEKRVVIEERRESVENSPDAALSIAVDAALYGPHPYGRPVIGSAAEIDAADAADVRAFRRRWYGPANAVLVVAGDVTAATVRALAERHYGPLPGGVVPLRARPTVPQQPPRRLTIADSRTRHPLWLRKYPAASARIDPAASLATEVLAQILGGGSDSRLYRRLVVELKLAAGLSVGYEPDLYDGSALEIAATPRPGVAVARLQGAVDAELRHAAAAITPAEVERAKRRLIAQSRYARDAVITGPLVIGEALTAGQTLEAVESWSERLDAVSPAAVAAVAATVLAPCRAVTGVLRERR